MIKSGALINWIFTSLLKVFHKFLKKIVIYHFLLQKEYRLCTGKEGQDPENVSDKSNLYRGKICTEHPFQGCMRDLNQKT